MYQESSLQRHIRDLLKANSLHNHIHNGIHISGSSVLKHQASVREAGIEAVLRLDGLDRAEMQWDSHFTLLDMPFSDGEAVAGYYFERGTAFIHEQVSRGRQVLVHCQMGVSRSVTMTMAYLIRYEGMCLGRAYRTVKKGRPIAQPHNALVMSLVAYYGLPFHPTDVYAPFFLDKLAAQPR